MEEEDRPRPRGDAADRLAGEDLGPFSQDELSQRIRVLQLEIARVEQHRARKDQHRTAANALFSPKQAN